MTATEEQKGRVLEASRRHVTLLLPSGEQVSGTVSSRAIELATGDEVNFELRSGRVFVTAVAEARRRLFRSYRGVVKRMGSNIDHLFVITAVGETLNPLAIDRMIIAGSIEQIPLTLVVNKHDLGIQNVAFITSVYRDAGVPVLGCSAKRGEGLEPIFETLERPDVETIALCGVSGVGKSTILNRLVPDAKARTAEVSQRTGQGRQTTSQPRGFLFHNTKPKPKVVIDFPGVQFFGLSHVEPKALAAAFYEFEDKKVGCRFIDCKHLQEPDCAVRSAVEVGQIAAWRYQSYLQILQEIEDAREY